jgi:oxygen-independent coproporphyrinogen-3 oxidase
MSPLGLYVHVPFCSAICHYCNFNRGLLDEALKARYVEALAAHIAREADGSPADTIYFGGGTPSLLAAAEVARVVEACRHAFAVTPDAEITLEANPETLTPGTLAGFRAAGVNRLSLGVQSFRDDELARLGRVHDADRARVAFGLARRAGFDNVSLDLMLWLPGQTLVAWLESVDALIGLAPEHASLYLLELYPNAPLRDEMARGGWHLPGDDLAASMYLEGLARLDRAGYGQYEISNVARPGRRSRHNMKYWTDGAWLAFGCGAHGSRNRTRWKNVASTQEYVERIASGSDVVTERWPLTPDEALGEAMFMGLRLADGVDLGAVWERYGVDPLARYAEGLEPFLEAGFLVTDGGRLRLTREAFLVANEIMAVFV